MEHPALACTSSVLNAAHYTVACFCPIPLHSWLPQERAWRVLGAQQKPPPVANAVGFSSHRAMQAWNRLSNFSCPWPSLKKKKKKTEEGEKKKNCFSFHCLLSLSFDYLLSSPEIASGGKLSKQVLTSENLAVNRSDLTPISVPQDVPERVRLTLASLWSVSPVSSVFTGHTVEFLSEESIFPAFLLTPSTLSTPTEWLRVWSLSIFLGTFFSVCLTSILPSVSELETLRPEVRENDTQGTRRILLNKRQTWFDSNGVFKSSQCQHAKPHRREHRKHRA